MGNVFNNGPKFRIQMEKTAYKLDLVFSLLKQTSSYF
jgi:hypothetical protein